jgi:hypothetical protein
MVLCHFWQQQVSRCYVVLVECSVVTRNVLWKQEIFCVPFSKSPDLPVHLKSSYLSQKSGFKMFCGLGWMFCGYQKCSVVTRNVLYSVLGEPRLCQFTSNHPYLTQKSLFKILCGLDLIFCGLQKRSVVRYVRAQICQFTPNHNMSVKNYVSRCFVHLGWIFLWLPEMFWGSKKCSEVARNVLWSVLWDPICASSAQIIISQ